MGVDFDCFVCRRYLKKVCFLGLVDGTLVCYVFVLGDIMLFGIVYSYKYNSLITQVKPVTPSNQRTNGPVNAQLISCSSKAQNIQNLENLTLP